MNRLVLIQIVLLFTLSSFAQGKLIISELMYHPQDQGIIDGDEYEFIEVLNIGNEVLSLQGYQIDLGIVYFFPNISLQPGEYGVIAKNQTRFEERYPNIDIMGTFLSGSLKNSGEALRISKNGVIIYEMTYSDKSPWPALADGSGFSLVPTDLNSSISPSDPNFWTISNSANGTPKSAETSEAVNYPIHINELLTAPSLGKLDIVELYNSSDSTIDISGWRLGDDINSAEYYTFPEGSMLDAFGFLVVDESDFNPNDSGFSFSRNGDLIFLAATNSNGELTGYSEIYTFEAMFENESFGRHTNSLGNTYLVRQNEPTIGNSNANPKIGPLVFDKIMYSPDAFLDQFIVLKNISSDPLTLTSNYLIDSNAYKVSGIGFKFPLNQVTLQANAVTILTNIDTASFRTKYKIDNNVPIFQFSGTLNKNGESLKIEIPLYRDTLNDGSYDNYNATIDEIDFLAVAPWPDADGNGLYLQRIDNNAFGSDPDNWITSENPILARSVTKPEINFSISNPVEDQISIFNASLFKGYTYKIVDASGRLIQSGDISSDQIDCKNLDKGTYYLSLKCSPHLSKTHSFVKQ